MPKPNFLVPKDSSASATKRLANEWARYNSAESTTSQSFECELVDRNLYRWKVRVKNQFPEPLQTQFVLYGSQFDVYDLVLELHFESTYPMVPPKLRVIEPRFLPGTIPSLGPGGVFESSLLRDGGDWTPISTVHTCVTDIIGRMTTACANKDENFTFFDASIRAPYLSSEAHSQRIGFIQHYRTMVFDDIGTEMGGKITLPPSALENISRAQNPEFPLIFELKQTRVHSESLPLAPFSDFAESSMPLPTHSTSQNALYTSSGLDTSLSHTSAHTQNQLKKTYAGVSTFDAVEGYAMVPSWIAKNFHIVDGDEITVRMVSLPKGELVTLQPQDPDTFLALSQPKEALESVLTSYVSLQTNDSLHVAFDQTLYTFTIVKTLPAPAIDIRDTDLKLEIQMPPGYDHDKDEPSFFPISDSQSRQSPPKPSSSHEASQLTSSNNIDSGTNGITCSNCRKQIPKNSQATHEAFCRRNNIPCELCGHIMRISDKQAHFEETHKLIKCSCGESMEIRLLAHHKQHDCGHRLKACQYCKLRKKIIDLPDHEAYCGSRTEKCAKCQKFVSVKDFQQHTASRCQYPASPEPTGLLSRLKSFFASATDGP